MAEQEPETTIVDNDPKDQQANVLQAATHNLSLVIDQLQTIDIPKLDEVVEILDNAKMKLESVSG